MSHYKAFHVHVVQFMLYSAWPYSTTLRPLTKCLSLNNLKLISKVGIKLLTELESIRGLSALTGWDQRRQREERREVHWWIGGREERVRDGRDSSENGSNKEWSKGDLSPNTQEKTSIIRGGSEKSEHFMTFYGFSLLICYQKNTSHLCWIAVLVIGFLKVGYVTWRVNAKSKHKSLCAVPINAY